MPSIFGWWDLDPDQKSMINRITRQRLTLIGRRPSAAWSQNAVAAEYHFTYQDDDLRYPLLVRTHPRAHYPHFPHWVVDHVASAEAWRRRNAGTSGPPPFGLWQRVDDCVLDAMLCWPDLPDTNAGTKASAITATGGWVDGAWTDDLRREVSTKFFDFATEGKPIASRRLEALDLPPPLRWQYCDAPNSRQGARLSGVEEIAGRLWLPPEAPLSGFEDQVPYLRRADGRAVMFPAGLASYFYRQEDYAVRMLVDYADEDVLLRVSCENTKFFIGNEFPAAWSFDLSNVSNTRLGLRNRSYFDPASPHRFPPDLFDIWPKNNFPLPSYALCQRLCAALINGWLNWTGTPHRMAETPEWLAQQSSHPYGVGVPAVSGMDLAQRPGVQIKGGYVGGLATSLREQRTWLEKGPLA